MSKVGCEGTDGLLRIHPEAETCEVCAPALPVEIPGCPAGHAVAIVEGRSAYFVACPAA